MLLQKLSPDTIAAFSEEALEACKSHVQKVLGGITSADTLKVSWFDALAKLLQSCSIARPIVAEFSKWQHDVQELRMSVSQQSLVRQLEEKLKVCQEEEDPYKFHDLAEVANGCAGVVLSEGLQPLLMTVMGKAVMFFSRQLAMRAAKSQDRDVGVRRVGALQPAEGAVRSDFLAHGEVRPLDGLPLRARRLRGQVSDVCSGHAEGLDGVERHRAGQGQVLGGRWRAGRILGISHPQGLH